MKVPTRALLSTLLIWTCPACTKERLVEVIVKPVPVQVPYVPSALGVWTPRKPTGNKRLDDLMLSYDAAALSKLALIGRDDTTADILSRMRELDATAYNAVRRTRELGAKATDTDYRRAHDAIRALNLFTREPIH